MSMTRRGFIKNAMASTALIAGSSLLYSCAGVRREDFTRTMVDRKMNGTDLHKLHNILYFASLAPSGHNSQPWMVRILDAENLIIKLDEKRLLPAVDPLARESLLSLGAFLENLMQAAEAQGMTVQWTMDDSDEFPAIHVKLEVSNHNKEDAKLIHQRIAQRRTVKSNYLAKEIKRQDIDFILADGKQYSSYIPANSNGSKKLNEIAVEAMREQCSRKEANTELAQWIRLKSEEAEKKRDGLTTESMEINGIAGWFVRNMMSRESLTSADFVNKGIEKTEQQVSRHGGWIVLNSKGKTSLDTLETGMMFERMVLKCREKSIAMHPMSQILEEQAAGKSFKQQFGFGENTQFILRVGYQKNYPDPVSLRRPVEWFLN